MTGRRKAVLVAPLLFSVLGAGAFGRPATRPGRDAADRARDERVEDERPDRAPDRGRRVLEDGDDAADARDADDDRAARRDRLRDDRGEERDGGGRAGRRARDLNSDDWFRDPSRYQDNDQPGDFPSSHVREAVVANARAATSRAIFRRAENALNAAVRHARKTFESSEELRGAVTEERQAYEAYAQAREAALKSVQDDPKYQSLISLRNDLGGKITAHRRASQAQGIDEGAYFDQILTMAALKMNYASDARAMEQEAMTGDNTLRDAREKLVAANGRVLALRQEFDQSLRDDPDLLAARRSLEDARIARLAAAAYLKGALSAADEALNFAYYLHRYDGSRYADYRYDYPYSYGYGGY